MIKARAVQCDEFERTDTEASNTDWGCLQLLSVVVVLW